MSTLGGYHDERSVNRGMFSTSGDIMMNVGDTMSTSGDVQYIGGCSVHRRDIMIHVGDQLDKIFQFLLKTPMY